MANNQFTFASHDARIASKIEMITESGCWIWLGSLNEDGYGQAWDGERMRKAHSLLYEQACGLVADVTSSPLRMRKTCGAGMAASICESEHTALLDMLTQGKICCSIQARGSVGNVGGSGASGDAVAWYQVNFG